MNGNLLEKARNYFRSQRLPIGNVKWERMSEALAKNGPNSQEYNQLLLEEEIYDEIKGELTNIAKNDKTDTLEGYKLLFIKFNNHIYSIFQLIDPNRII